MTDRRQEPHAEGDLAVRVWGINTRGERFLQEVRAHQISFGGALLSQLDAELKPGDLIGVLYGGKKARFRVIWVRDCGNERKIQAAIHRVNGDECPWEDLLPKEERGRAAGAGAHGD